MDKTIFFETIKCFDGVPFYLEYHKKRIAQTISKNIDLSEYIFPPNDQLLRCKLIYNKDEIKEIHYFPYEKKHPKTFEIIFDDSIEYSSKYLDRSQLDFHKKSSIADEIFIFKNNLLTDSLIANIAIFIDNRWFTPKLPLLKGTTRERYIKNGLLIEKDIDIKLLHQSTKIALLNCMIDFEIIENFKFI